MYFVGALVRKNKFRGSSQKTNKQKNKPKKLSYLFYSGILTCPRNRRFSILREARDDFLPSSRASRSFISSRNAAFASLGS